MPELPEVETIVRGLKDFLPGREIIDVVVKEKKLIGFPEKEQFINTIPHKIINDVSRRGKYILISLSEDKLLVVHLRMTGKLLIKKSDEALDKHTHIIFKLNDNYDLRFNNVRKFGRIYFISQNDYEQAGGLAELGPEPLAEEFTLKDFSERIKSRSARIKSLLLNQSFLAGIGNIYADESLFAAGILPDRRASDLTPAEVKKLYHSIRNILQEGIKFCGTSFSDYVNVKGEKGGFQDKLKVYQHQGEKCPCCGQTITKKKIGGRSSYYCPQCQQ